MGLVVFGLLIWILATCIGSVYENLLISLYCKLYSIDKFSKMYWDHAQKGKRRKQTKIQLYKHCPGCFTDKSEDHLRRSDLWWKSYPRLQLSTCFYIYSQLFLPHVTHYVVQKCIFNDSQYLIDMYSALLKNTVNMWWYTAVERTDWGGTF